MTTMKTSKHEINKAQWQELIREQSESGLSIREWCIRHNMSHGKFYYWQRIIREEALIKAGTLVVTGQTQFIEVKPSMAEFRSNNQGTCAILRSNGNEIEVLNISKLVILLCYRFFYFMRIIITKGILHDVSSTYSNFSKQI